ncbi:MULTISPECIES: hypothetical protein [Nocardiopsis]|uniref:Uncharacterized protein n=1 Tax=Nocardiopsis sinuspersici TaxID=501010 RepID=A0A1V3C834_9ACTN|nr:MULTISPECIES: hypothetical protein [Nocardiopsis]OOC56853.1 hypothetical protein NOSIN_25960 [Nocardiopsis sinuspersici]
MIPILIALVGVVLLGLATGFFLAVSIGIRRRDSRGTYRSLRDDEESTPLSRTGSLVVGLRFRDGGHTAPDPDHAPSGRVPSSGRTPTPV